MRRRYLAVLLLAGLAGAILVGTQLTRLFSGKPRVVALVFIPMTTPPYSMFDQRHDERFLQKQRALVRSRLVLNSALQRPEVAQLLAIKEQGDAFAWLESALRVDFPDSTEIMHVGLKGENTEELIVVVDAVVEAYLDHVAKQMKLNQEDRLRRLEELASAVEGCLKRKRQFLRNLDEQRKVVSPKSFAIEQLLNQEQCNAVQAELDHLRAEMHRSRQDENLWKELISPAGAHESLWSQASPEIRERVAWHNEFDPASRLTALRAENALRRDLETILMAEFTRLTDNIRSHAFTFLDLEAFRPEIQQAGELLENIQAIRTVVVRLKSPQRAQLLHRAAVRVER